MLYKQTPFELVLINPGSRGETGSRHPDYLAKNPGGTIPMIEETATGVVLRGGHALLCLPRFTARLGGGCCGRFFSGCLRGAW
ncbi:MAG: hypothetical protein OXE40_13075, partial [Gammaproteobacteria bacterium]|nr:hypothetical protein [Gammaproteobacteria bacterium]